MLKLVLQSFLYLSNNSLIVNHYCCVLICGLLQVSREHSYVPQAATVLPDVRESVMVPVDVVKHGSQPGKQLAAIQG